jgi:hypothetical protein
VATQPAPSDAELIDGVARRLTPPKADGVTSFTLHAPLELLARTALLPVVEPDGREPARERLAWLGKAYRDAGDEVGPPPRRSFDDPSAAAARLVRAIDAGDLDEADATSVWLTEHLTPVELAAVLADDVIPRLSAAGHGSILLYLLPRAAPRSPAAAGPLRGLARELARNPTWRLSWYEEPDAGSDGADDLTAVLRRPRSPGDPGSDFIHPTMSIVESSGLAEELLRRPTRDLGVADASRSLLRLAAASMLQDAEAAAPYGWTHCLTMPQAVLGLARAGHAAAGPAVAVAATHVLGFRATQGRTDVDPTQVPPATSDPLAALDGAPAAAAAGAWHAAGDDRSAVVARLATRAAAHEDAHLAKYTLACFDAARDDPPAAQLFVAAAAHLGAWWRRHDGVP